MKSPIRGASGSALRPAGRKSPAPRVKIGSRRLLCACEPDSRSTPKTQKQTASVGVSGLRPFVRDGSGSRATQSNISSIAAVQQLLLFLGKDGTQAEKAQALEQDTNAQAFSTQCPPRGMEGHEPSTLRRARRFHGTCRDGISLSPVGHGFCLRQGNWKWLTGAAVFRMHSGPTSAEQRRADLYSTPDRDVRVAIPPRRERLPLSSASRAAPRADVETACRVLALTDARSFHRTRIAKPVGRILQSKKCGGHISRRRATKAFVAEDGSHRDGQNFCDRLYMLPCL